MAELTQRTPPWATPEYQRFASVTGDGFDLLVRFENGDELRMDVRRLLNVDSEPDWSAIVVAPDEFQILTGAGPAEVAWLDLRALTDPHFAAHLAERADEQARQVGHRLRMLRERRKLQSRELAERAGISAQSLSRIERGRHDVVFSTLQRLLAAMNYELADLAAVDDVQVEPAAVRKALAATGLDKQTIARVLFGASEPAAVLARVRNVFSWSPTDLAGPAPPPVLAGAVAAGRFKEQTRDRRAALTYVLYAHKVGMLADRAADRPAYTPPPDDPTVVRGEILDRYGNLRFESVARYCWDHGIVIVPMADRGQFHGACWLIGGRPVIVLKQGLAYDSRWAFDLGHELCHVRRHLRSDEPAIVEFDAIGIGDEDEEIEASGFAGQLLLGDPDTLAERVVEVARGHGPRLKGAVVKVAAESGVDAGVLANYLAYRLDLQDFEFPFWSVAATLQEGDRNAPQVCRRLLEEHLDLDRLADDDRLVLLGALSEEEEPS